MKLTKSKHHEELLKYGLYFDLVERIRTIDRNILYLYSLSNFLKDYYVSFFNIGDKNNEILSHIVYGIYSTTLNQIIEDMKTIRVNLKNLYDALIKETKSFGIDVEDKDDVGTSDKNSNLNDPFESFIRNIMYKGYPLKESKDPYSKIFRDYQNIKVSKQFTELEINVNSVDELLIWMRNMIDTEHLDSIRIALGTITKSLASITYSINQSLGGLFVGNIIEQEPSVYPHKDLFMIMNLASFVCRGYDDFLRNLLKNSLLFKDNEAKTLYYNVSGICLDDDKDNKIKYTIVFGNCTLPEIMDRYKLIHLPITCAYRPRYWPALAHEVAHSYVNGLLYLRDIVRTVKILNKNYEKIYDKFYRCNIIIISNLSIYFTFIRINIIGYNITKIGWIWIIYNSLYTNMCYITLITP